MIYRNNLEHCKNTGNKSALLYPAMLFYIEKTVPTVMKIRMPKEEEKTVVKLFSQSCRVQHPNQTFGGRQAAQRLERTQSKPIETNLRRERRRDRSLGI